MSEPAPTHDPHAPIAGRPGRPRIDVPGLEQPAAFCAAILSHGDYGHRAVLVVGSEDGDTVTNAQLASLAEGLEGLYGGEAPEGSRAWLRAKAAQWQEAAERLNRLHVDALQQAADLRRERDELEAAIDADGPLPRGRIADTVHNLRGRAEVAERALQTARAELEAATRAAREADEDAGRYANALTGLEAQRDRAREEVAALQERLAHSIDARAALLDAWRADTAATIRRHQQLHEAARRNLRRGAAAGALSALTTAAAAWAARHRGVAR